MNASFLTPNERMDAFIASGRAPERPAEIDGQAADGYVRRVAAVFPKTTAETADEQVRVLSPAFAKRHRSLLDRLAE